jgi:hypothetical protein
LWFVFAELEIELTNLALNFALDNAGKSMVAGMAMMANHHQQFNQREVTARKTPLRFRLHGLRVDICHRFAQLFAAGMDDSMFVMDNLLVFIVIKVVTRAR